MLCKHEAIGSSPIISILCNDITQLVEWWNHNPYVTGSSPVIIIPEYSAVGSAPVLGTGGHVFKSRYSDLRLDKLVIMKDFHSILCLLLFFSGLMVAFSTNPVESVLFLILAFFNAGAILITFNAEFLGLIFIIVYVGAIAVLFLFVIMMLNVKIHENIFQRLFVENKSRFAFLSFLFYLSITILYVFIKSVVGSKDHLSNFGFNIFGFVDSLNNIDVLGQVLYNYYLVSFLLAGLILLVALIGAIVLTLRFNSTHKTQIVSRQLARRDNFLSFFN